MSIHRLIGAIAFAVVAIVLPVIILEIALCYYASHVKLEGRIYRSDPVLGYYAIPNNVKRRRLSDGEVIDYITNVEGERIASSENPAQVRNWKPTARRRVLIVGDSFSEGSCQVEQRLDRVIMRKDASLSVREFGCGGFGTDQQLLLAERLLPDLQSDDVVVVLTCANDFEDNLRSFNFGRAKPRFELVGDSVIHITPPFSVVAKLREISYIISYFSRIARPQKQVFINKEMAYSERLYVALLRVFAGRLSQRGIHLVVAHHSKWYLRKHDLTATFEQADSINGVTVVDIDPLINRKTMTRPCGHWNADGYRRVAEIILTELGRTDDSHSPSPGQEKPAI